MRSAMWKGNSPQSTTRRNFMWCLSVFSGDRTGSLACPPSTCCPRSPSPCSLSHVCHGEPDTVAPAVTLTQELSSSLAGEPRPTTWGSPSGLHRALDNPFPQHSSPLSALCPLCAGPRKKISLRKSQPGSQSRWGSCPSLQTSRLRQGTMPGFLCLDSTVCPDG